MGSRRPVLNVEARRMMPWTSYPFESMNSARYEPSWPVMPVISALGMRVSPGARCGPRLRGQENVSRNGGEFNDGPGRAALRIRADRHVESAGGLPGGGGTAVRDTAEERLVAGHVRGEAGKAERAVPRRGDGGAGARPHPPHGRGAGEGGRVDRAAVFGEGTGRFSVRGLDGGGVGVRDVFGAGGKFFLLNMWEKGPVWMKLSASGRSGHGSRPSPSDAPARLARAMGGGAAFRGAGRRTRAVR